MGRRQSKGINDSKFELVRFGHCNIPASYLTSKGLVIDNKSQLRDLGITITSDARFDVHIANIVQRAVQWLDGYFVSLKPEKSIPCSLSSRVWFYLI